MSVLNISELTEYFLKQNVDLTVTTSTGDTILHGGVHGNHPEIVEMLIKAGKDIIYTCLMIRDIVINQTTAQSFYDTVTGVQSRVIVYLESYS